MNKIYISSLLIVLMAGAQSIRAQESDYDALMAEVDATAVDTAQSAGDSGAVGGEAPAKDLYTRGTQAYDAGDYDLAMKIFEAMLAKDPYDTRAMKHMRLTADKIAANARRLTESIRAGAMTEIKEDWTPDMSKASAVVSQPEEKTESPEEKAVKAMTARLKGLMIPTLDFRDANIKDVILFLSETCRRMDEPTHNGINIVLLGLDNSDSMGSDIGNNITVSVRDMSLFDSLQAIVEMADLKFEVQPEMVTVMPINYVRSVDLTQESLEVITEVGDELASMAGADDSGGGMDDLFGDSSAIAAPTGPVDVKGYFSYVQWPERASATYYPAFNKLVVKNTPESIDKVKKIVATLTDKKIRERSNQVQIEAKFVEFNEGALEQLGFDWNIYGTGSIAGFEMTGTGYEAETGFTSPQRVNRNLAQGGGTEDLFPYYYETGGSLLWSDPVKGFKALANGGQNLFGGGQRGNQSAFDTLTSGLVAQMGGLAPNLAFSNGSVDLNIAAMEQEGTADVLSSPKVTTQSGNEAVIRVVEIHRYPQDYDVETGQRTAPVVKPQDWEDFDLGVVLRVTPDVDTDKGTILLQLDPEIRKFKGFDDYAVAVNAYALDGGFAGSSTEIYGDGGQLFARMPYFETRSISTRVTVADGHTVLMGGLLDERTETFRDQVPFLGDIPYIGRLFRTEGSRSEKKNLVIAVTATQVDEEGLTRSDRDLAGSAVFQ